MNQSEREVVVFKSSAGTYEILRSTARNFFDAHEDIATAEILFNDHDEGTTQHRAKRTLTKTTVGRTVTRAFCMHYINKLYGYDQGERTPIQEYVRRILYEKNLDEYNREFNYIGVIIAIKLGNWEKKTLNRSPRMGPPIPADLNREEQNGN